MKIKFCILTLMIFLMSNTFSSTRTPASSTSVILSHDTSKNKMFISCPHGNEDFYLVSARSPKGVVRVKRITTDLNIKYEVTLDRKFVGSCDQIRVRYNSP